MMARRVRVGRQQLLGNAGMFKVLYLNAAVFSCFVCLL